MDSNSFTQELSKILYDRALSYLNVDISVSGHDHIRIKATPLLYSAIYMATKMVSHIDMSSLCYTYVQIFDCVNFMNPSF